MKPSTARARSQLIAACAALFVSAGCGVDGDDNGSDPMVESEAFPITVATAHLTVWLSHDGYRDPDDNLAILVGAAQAWKVAKSDNAVSVGGVVFGDTKDGGQYYMLNPMGTAPQSFGNDSRYGDRAGNKVAAGNYEFYRDYARPAIRGMAPGWAHYDLLAQDNRGLRAWNFDAAARSAISAASAALADDIKRALSKPNELVIYSAGGGANVAAEALGHLYRQGHTKAEIKAHFAIIQHGRSNWESQYEAKARDLTRDFTIAVSNQNMALYANGMKGPDLKHAIPNPGQADGSAYGSAFDVALDVALGKRAYVGLKAGTTFRATTDASDAGSHAFAVDVGQVVPSLSKRLGSGESLPNGDDWAHRIATPSGSRLRVIYRAFTDKEISELFDGT